MGKIYNIHSKTLSSEGINQISDSIDSNKHIILFNEDFRYEIIDTEKGQRHKSSFLRNLLVPYYVIKNIIVRVRGNK